MSPEIGNKKKNFNPKEKWVEPKLDVLSINATKGDKTSNLDTEGAGNIYYPS